MINKKNSIDLLSVDRPRLEEFFLAIIDLFSFAENYKFYNLNNIPCFENRIRGEITYNNSNYAFIG